MFLFLMPKNRCRSLFEFDPLEEPAERVTYKKRNPLFIFAQFTQYTGSTPIFLGQFQICWCGERGSGEINGGY